MKRTKRINDRREMEFEEGDRVVCWLGNSDVPAGKEFTVIREYDSLGDFFVLLEGESGGHWASRFELLDDYIFETKEISREGCHPDVEAHLRKNQAVKMLCFEAVGDSFGIPDYITGFLQNVIYPYRGLRGIYKRVERLPKEEESPKVDVTLDGKTVMISRESADSLRDLFIK
jgi:hypothetical protein